MITGGNLAQKSITKLDMYTDCQFGNDVRRLLEKNGITPKCTRVYEKRFGEMRPTEKWRCNLSCDNGNYNAWSVRRLKCQVMDDLWGPPLTGSKSGETRSSKNFYRWRPQSIKQIETLCDKRVDCDKIQDQYNVSDEHLSWKKTQVNERQTRFDFV